MEWKNYYLDIVLVPLGLSTGLLYHLWLWHKVRTQPFQTIIGINHAGQRLWVLSMMKDEKKNILAVQSIRNSIMGTTLMATTTILLTAALAAVLSSTYSIKKPMSDTVYGGHGERMLAIKYVTILFFFLFTFLCYTLSVRFISQVNFLINVPCGGNDASDLTPTHVCDLMSKASALNIVGNRLFYTSLPLLMWIIGPVLVFLCSFLVIPILYNLDFVYGSDENRKKKEDCGEMMSFATSV